MAEIPNLVPIQATQTLAPAKEDVHQRAGGAKRSARVLLEAAAAPRGPLSLPVPSPVLCSPSRSWPGACHLSSPGQTHSSGVNLFPSLCVSARLLIGLDKQQENILRSFGSLAQLPRALCLFSQNVSKDLGRPPNTGLMHRPAPHIPPKLSCSSRPPCLSHILSFLSSLGADCCQAPLTSCGRHRPKPALCHQGTHAVFALLIGSVCVVRMGQGTKLPAGFLIVRGAWVTETPGQAERS